MGKKLIVSVTYENARISVINRLPYLKCVIRLSMWSTGRFMAVLWVFTVFFHFVQVERDSVGHSSP